MLTTAQLQALMADTESDRVERTISTKNTDKFAEAICAFANDFPNHRQPGYLLVGVNDEGRAGGLTVTDALLRDLANLRSNVNLEPIPALTVQKKQLPDGEVAVVEVIPSNLPPVRYKGRVWIRVGPSRRAANQQEERILTEKRTAFQKTFDGRPCEGCALDDLVLDLFLVTYLPAAVAREVIEENKRDIRQQMASLRFFDLGADCPTHAGALLFAKEPLRWVPGAYIQFVRWGGTTMADNPLNTKQFSGDLLTVLREMQAFLSLPAAAAPVAESALRERTETDYPTVAIRELLWNAVMHRSYESNAPVRFYWYDDRIEIQNPGGLYGMASPENFPKQTDYRNPVVSEAMATLGFVNMFGRGVIRAQDALRRNGNPPAEFTFETSHVLATIRRKP
ncbi:MAG TPA: ATP-binding protein [Verrucomicrobiota bacterium]|jgi:ATP-dependent DNA helicase RecG|nr:ATP-binding protein [Verrucomicrobiota bacterium]OQC63396.1 MAG: Divergent AAA domain protein [Verrucomicrobia bacterium ADurb.Bin006]HPG01301.1 ATP-binding protein [Kiritimatiellia bacterium]NMD19741.1 transcriptional regulator [Verrucomicrobiota bacterium]HNU99048.1 ATP-binding protein [Verrucomicrobiota bacterium]